MPKGTGCGYKRWQRVFKRPDYYRFGTAWIFTSIFCEYHTVPVGWIDCVSPWDGIVTCRFDVSKLLQVRSEETQADNIFSIRQIYELIKGLKLK